MESLSQMDEVEAGAKRPSQQVASFLLHTVLALVTWITLMCAGYLLNPAGVPQWAVLLLSFAAPLAVGLAVNRIRQDETAVTIWLVGLMWLLIIALWVLDMPTGPNACLQCGATDKLTRTFFSFPAPSGLIDDDGPFLGTWPAAALVGYAVGAKLALRRKHST